LLGFQDYRVILILIPPIAAVLSDRRGLLPDFPAGAGPEAGAPVSPKRKKLTGALPFNRETSEH
jgi:hypothetical protein